MTISAQSLKGLEYVRGRLRDMINGDTDVDVAAVMHILDKEIVSLGGKSLDYAPHEYKPRYFSMYND